MFKKFVLLVVFFLSTYSCFGFGDGDGSSENPFQIATATHMDAVRNNLAAHYVVTADLDLSEFALVEHMSEPMDEEDIPYVVATGWLPIGNYHNPFTGVFDGGGFTISGLVFERHNQTFNGLFGCARSAILKNVTLANVNIVGGYRTEPLVGYAISSQQTGIVFSGVITDVERRRYGSE